jgi:hypothetical protein
MKPEEQARAAPFVAEEDRELFLKQIRQINGKSPLIAGPNKTQDRLQGDVLRDFPFAVIHRDGKVLSRPQTCLALNTDCNLQPGRLDTLNFAPISSFARYAELAAAKQKDPARLAGRLESVERNEVDSLFYLPFCGGFDGPVVVHLNRISSVHPDVFEQCLAGGQRVSSLTQLGFYVLLLKVTRLFARPENEVSAREQLTGT